MTIGIPVYNQAEYLADAIESALSQTVNCEVIVCNDGSTDNSLEVAKKYPVKIINQVNKGLASARNAIIMNAKDEWILWLDADDLLMNNAVERIEQMIKETEADIIAPSLQTFGSSSQVIILTPNPKLEDFRAGNMIGYCAAVRKSVLLEVGGYNPKMVEGYEDLALWCDLLSRGKKLITLRDILWLYRTKDESMWTKITPEIHNKLLAQINKDVPQAQLSFQR